MGIRNLFVFSVHRTRGVCAAPYFNNFYYVTDYLYRNSSGWVPVLVPLESDRKCMKFQMVDERTKKTTTIVYLRFSVGAVAVVVVFIGGGGGSRWNFVCALENLLGYL